MCSHQIPPQVLGTCRAIQIKLNIPFAFTHVAFRLGSAAWSLMCSGDSKGSLYIIRLLDLLLLPACFPSFILFSPEGESFLGGGAEFVFGAKASVLGNKKEDSLAVLIVLFCCGVVWYWQKLETRWRIADSRLRGLNLEAAQCRGRIVLVTVDQA
jgi:hypothetical protein